MVCPGCGANLTDDALFCRECGKTLRDGGDSVSGRPGHVKNTTALIFCGVLAVSMTFLTVSVLLSFEDYTRVAKLSQTTAGVTAATEREWSAAASRATENAASREYTGDKTVVPDKASAAAQTAAPDSQTVPQTTKLIDKTLSGIYPELPADTSGDVMTTVDSVTAETKAPFDPDGMD